jgi:hypothetical protein
MHLVSRLIRIAAVGACLASPVTSMAGDAGSEWQQTAFVYGMGAALDGEAQVGAVVVPVDLSMSEMFDALEFGAMAAYRADNGTWSFTGDATFMALGGSGRTERDRLQATLDVDQLTLMATVGRRLSEHVEALVGFAYLSLSADLRVRSTSGELVDLARGREASWVDPTVGLQFNRPLGRDWRLNLRADVGGFGLGSDLLVHALANVRWQLTEAVGVVFGYRYIGFDYEEGQGLGYEHFELSEQGPLIGVSFSF